MKRENSQKKGSLSPLCMVLLIISWYRFHCNAKESNDIAVEDIKKDPGKEITRIAKLIGGDELVIKLNESDGKLTNFILEKSGLNI